MCECNTVQITKDLWLFSKYISSLVYKPMAFSVDKNENEIDRDFKKSDRLRK